MDVIIEMGGTKVNIFSNEKSSNFNKSTIHTSAPDEFKASLLSRFSDNAVDNLILACFGPISFHERDYGTILNSPKNYWKNTNLYEWIKENICTSTVLVTDVTLSALGAMKKYNLQHSFFSYVTIGTGIGGCNIFKGNVLQNRFHPEIGHMYLAYSKENICPYHDHCFEGQTSGYTFSSKYGKNIGKVDASHPGLKIQLNNLSRLVYNLYAAVGVDYIILGGGAISKSMKNQLIENLEKLNNSYLPIFREKLAESIIIEENSDDLALLGGMYLLNEKLNNKRS